MDPFSQILSGVVLKGALFFNAEFSAPWGFNAPPAQELTPWLAPDAPHLLIYHFLVDGSGVVRIGDDAPISLEPGDVVVVPHGDSHRMCSVQGMDQSLSDAMIAKLKTRDLTAMHAGGGGDVARFVCGFMVCDPLLCRPILQSLPPAFKVNLRSDKSGQWLETTLLHLVEEAASENAGSEAVLAKLSEALFIDTLRRYLSALPEQQVGWLAAARDPVIGKSLMLLHSRSPHPWTIAELAKEVGLSRSSLVERFTKYLSEPPMAYLMHWRLKLAARALASTSRGIAEIAEDVGYESEAAFNRAFKREFGLPPARYRNEHRMHKTHKSEPQTGIPKTLTLNLLCLFVALVCAFGGYRIQAQSRIDFFRYKQSPVTINEVSSQQRGDVTVRDITFSPVPGRTTKAYLVVPKGNGPFAGILWVHWLGEEKSNRTQFLDEAVELAPKGAVSLLVDAMWSDEKWFGNRVPEKDYENSIRQVIELRRALDLLLSQSNVDKTRIGYVGHDYGAMYGMLMAGADHRINTFVFVAATQSLNDWAFLGPQPKSKSAYLKQNANLELTDSLRQVKNASKFFQFGKNDFFISQADAAILFRAAPEPKQRKLYEASHQMESKEIEKDRDDWLVKQLKLGS